MNPGMNAGIDLSMKENPPQITAFPSSTVQKRVAAAVALGKSGNPSAILPLTQSLSDPHWKVRRESAQALGRLNDGDAHIRTQ